MKQFALVLWVCAGAVASALGQESAPTTSPPPSEIQAPPPAAPPPATPAPGVDASFVRVSAQSVMFQTKLLQRVLGVQVELGGAVPMALEVDNPLQLFNPFAPPEYGDGYDNTSRDPETGRPNGIQLFRIGF